MRIQKNMFISLLFLIFISSISCASQQQNTTAGERENSYSFGTELDQVLATQGAAEMRSHARNVAYQGVFALFCAGASVGCGFAADAAEKERWIIMAISGSAVFGLGALASIINAAGSACAWYSYRGPVAHATHSLEAKAHNNTLNQEARIEIANTQ